MDFTFILQLALMIWALFAANQLGFLLSRSKEKPINIVARTIAKVIHQHLPEVHGRFDQIAMRPEGLRFLQVAQEYLSYRAASIYKLELDRSRLAAENFRRSQDAEASEPWSEWAIAFIILAVSIVAALLLACLLALLQSYPVIVLSLVAVVTLMLWLENRREKPALDFVPVIGPASDWTGWQPRTSKECETERTQIFMAITGAGGDVGGNFTGQAPELEAAADTALPAPPGLSEIVLVNFPEALKEIRDEILTLRGFHRRVFVSVLILWFLIILVGFGMQIFWFNQPWTGSFGTLGFALVIGGILWGFLPAVRTSHIALALYESYQLELMLNLKVAEDISDTVKKSMFRAEAWERFRIGLNKLWLQENRSSAFTANLFRKYSQPITSSNETGERAGGE